MENTEITTTGNQIDFIAKAKEFLTSQGNKLPQKQLTQFLELANSFQLNPFKREIYAVGYGENWNIITGFEVYLKRAERTGLLDGWETEESGSVKDGTLKSTITIYRKDRSHPFKHTVYYVEAVNKTKDKQTGQEKPNAIWSKMPVYMTKKVAMAQGFRLCFPDELAGMPYTADEINEPETIRDITPKTETPKEDVYKMNKEQAEKMREMFADIIFTENEKQVYRDALNKHEMTAVELLDHVTEVYNNRKNQTLSEMVSEVFDA